MNRKWALFILIFSMAFVSLSCGFSVDLGQSKPTATIVLPTVALTITSAPSSIPESVSTSAVEASPTEQAIPTVAPSPTPISPPQVISAGNAPSLSYKRGYGLGSLQKMKVSPDGKTALLSYSASLILVNLNDLSVVWKIDPGKLLWDVTFSKDGSHLISATLGGTVQTWDASSGSLLSTTISQMKGVHDISLSENGEYFAILDFKDVTTIWDTTSGKQVQDNNGVANPGGINHISLSPGGGVLLIDGVDSKRNKQVQQWKVTDGTYKIGLLGLMQEMSNWEFSPDANRIFGINHRSLTANRSTVLTAWNANNGALIKTFDSVGLITRYLVSPDGSTILAATEDNVIHIINVETGKEKASFAGHSNEIAAMGFSPDSQGVISIDVSGKIIQWDIMNQAQIRSVDGFYVSPISPVVFSTYGKLVALLSPDMKSVGILDTNTWQPVQKVGPEQKILNHVAISPAGTYVAACDEENKIIIWEVASGKKVQMIEAKTRSPIWKMKFSPDEKLLSSLSDGQIIIWNIVSGQKQKELAGYNDFDFSPTEKIIASDSLDFNLYFTDVESGKKLSTIPGEYNNSITYSPNGRYIAVGGQKNQPRERGLNNLVFQIDSHSKERLPVEMPEIPGLVTNTAYSPSMDLLATRDEQANVQIWDLRDGKLVALFEEISLSPGGLTFNQDGSILYVGGDDGTIGVISTTGTNTSEVPAAAEPGTTTVPELSDQPYTHSSGSITVNLPKGWKVTERGILSFAAVDPTGLGQIIVNITNTINQLSDDGFIKFVDSAEQRLIANSNGLKETNRKIEAQNGTGSLTLSTGEQVVIEMYFSRGQTGVNVITFITGTPVKDTYLPIYQGVIASIKLNDEVISKQIPYTCNEDQDLSAGFVFCTPFGWTKGETSQSTGPNVSYSAPDDSAALNTEIIPLKSESLSDDQVFIVMQTALKAKEADIQIIRKDKTTSGNWLITYVLPSKAKNGNMVGIRIDNSLQTLNVTYDTALESHYKPLEEKLIAGLKKK